MFDKMMNVDWGKIVQEIFKVDWNKVFSGFFEDATWLLIKRIMRTKGVFLETMKTDEGVKIMVSTAVGDLIVDAKPPQGGVVEFTGRMIRKSVARG